MADVAVPSVATATPANADTVLGVQGGVVKRFEVGELFPAAASTNANSASAVEQWQFGRPPNLGPAHPGQLTQSDTNVFGFTALSPTTDRIVVIFRKGVSTETTEGSPYIKYSDDGGATWSAEALMFTEAGKNLTNLAGGYAPNGDLVVFYVRYESPWPTFLSLNYRISTDDGATWGAEQTVNVGAATVFSAYGKMETLDNGTLAQCWYQQSPSYAVNMIFSSDNGATWGSQVTIASGGNSVTETDICALGGGGVVAVMRRDGQATYAMSMSTDNGATWNYSGTISQVSHTYEATTNISPCWLERFTDTLGRTVVAMYYYNRAYPAGSQPLRVIYALAADLISLGTTAWQASSDRILSNTHNGIGYPSAVHPYGDALGIGWSIVNNDVRFFHSYEGTPAGGIWNGRSLGLAIAPGSNRLAVGGALSVGTGTAGNTPPVNGAIIEGDLGVGETTSAGSYAAKVFVSSTGEQLRLNYSSIVYTSFTVSNTGYLNVNPTGGRVAIGTASAPTVPLNVFHATLPRVRLSTTASGLSSGLDLMYSGAIAYVQNLGGGPIFLSNLLQLTASASVPGTPAAGYVYLDDGTNTGDGEPHFRYYTGATWKNL